MAGIPVDVVSDICDQVGAWQRAFLSEASLVRYRRACAWTMSEVAKGACQDATAAVDRTFDNPKPLMRRAFKYTRGRFLLAVHVLGQVTSERLTAMLPGLGLTISKRQVVRFLSGSLDCFIDYPALVRGG